MDPPPQGIVSPAIPGRFSLLVPRVAAPVPDDLPQSYGDPLAADFTDLSPSLMLSSKEGWWMKKLVFGLLSGSLLVALCFLGGTEAATGKPMGFAMTTDTPTVAGSILNPVYFAHAAYVMQGVSDREKVFALPLRGVAELVFLPTAEGIDPAGVTWSLDVSHPEGIGAEIAGDTLYIWGNNAAWSGYGEVTLTSSTGSATGSVTIPVTVFCSDKALINAEGKKDYFVPWSPQLDINRILSVEEHMREYNKDEGFLDRTIRWSRWRRMDRLNDASMGTFWVLNGPAEMLRETADVVLWEVRATGFNAVRLENAYFMMTFEGDVIAGVFDRTNWIGPTKTDDEYAYLINESHRLGMQVIPQILVGVDPRVANGAYAELWQVAPLSPEAYWHAYLDLMLHQAEEWSSLGADFCSIGYGIEGVAPRTAETAALAEASLVRVADECRNVYAGPLVCFSGFNRFGPDRLTWIADWWEHVDVLGLGVVAGDMEPLCQTTTPTFDELVASWEKRIELYYIPFQQRYDKPFLAFENACPSFEGAAARGAYTPGAGADGEAIRAKAPLDFVEQSLYWDSFLEAFDDMPGYSGPGVWRYDFPGWMQGGVTDKQQSPRLKPVERVFERRFLGAEVPRPVRIDGALSEWQDEWQLASDPVADCAINGDDLLALWGCQDEDYVYFRLDFAARPRHLATLSIDLPSTRDWDFIISISPDGNRWGGAVMRRNATPWGSDPVGFADVAVAGNALEVRVHKRFLDWNPGPVSVHVAIAGRGGLGTDDELPGWYSVPWSVPTGAVAVELTEPKSDTSSTTAAEVPPEHLLEQPAFVIDDLRDGDFTNALSDFWQTFTEGECDAGSLWQRALLGQDAAASILLRHVSAAIVDRQDQNWIDWSFDAIGWVQLRTWLAPRDATHAKGAYLVLDSEQEIDLTVGIDYRQVRTGSWEDADLRSASAPVHLEGGKEETIVVPFDEFILDDPAWAIQGGNTLGDVDRTWLESIGLTATGDGMLATVYLREIGFYGVGR